jgi:hypothetical protein
MSPYHTIDRIEITADKLSMIVDGNEYSFPWATVSARLASATHDERSRFEISPAGYGIHWPLLDEDIAIDGLIGVHRIIPPPVWMKHAA